MPKRVLGGEVVIAVSVVTELFQLGATVRIERHLSWILERYYHWLFVRFRVMVLFDRQLCLVEVSDETDEVESDWRIDIVDPTVAKDLLSGWMAPTLTS